MSENQEGGQPNEQKNFVPKEDFEKLSNQFEKFTDAVAKHMIRSDMRDDQKSDSKEPESKSSVADVDADDIGLDEKALAYIEKKAEKIAEEKAKNLFKSASVESERSRLTNQLDQEAYDSFPDLKKPNTPLFIQTKKIMDEIRKVDPSADQRPDFVLSSALRAKKILEASANKTTTSAVETPRRYDGYKFEVGNAASKLNTTQKTEHISDRRLAMRKLLRGE